MKYICIVLLLSLSISSCVERGKPLEKEDTSLETEPATSKKNIDHYTCPNGHKGADGKGTCSECNSVLVHNVAYHGNKLAIPNQQIVDPFTTNAGATNSKPSPAQNAYGDYHYTCPKGHAGGSGKDDNCVTCNTKLTHNQLYHK